MKIWIENLIKIYELNALMLGLFICIITIFQTYNLLWFRLGFTLFIINAINITKEVTK